MEFFYRMRVAVVLCCTMLFSVIAQGQNVSVTGKVTDARDGSAISGANVAGGGVGALSGADGTFSISVPATIKNLKVTYVGYLSSLASISNGVANVELTSKTESGEAVVVIGYGSVKKKDLTGSVGTVTAKNFNKGINPAPDQLIQGKIAGVQVLNNSGAPGAGTTIRIRGNSSLRSGNTPLFVIDGVQISNTNSRPDISVTDVGGATPGGNPLNFVNPADIASMDVLKDAAATAIYGSRGANGVVIITTKRGKAGAPKVDFNASFGISTIAKKLRVLTGDEYRTALGQFGFPTTVSTTTTPTPNFGANVDALDEVLRKAGSQNYGVAVSAGTDNAKYRLSLGYLDQDGIIKKTGFKKYTANFTSSLKMLNSKKLNVDFSVLTTQTNEKIAPISNNAGFKGSLIGQALQWNPTRSLYKPDGTPFIEYGSDNINPVAYNNAYNDFARVTTILASVAPSYKLTNELEFKTQVSVNYSSGVRKQYLTAFINVQDIAIDNTPGSATFGRGGEVNVSQNELVTKQITNTLSYNKSISSNFSLNAVIGHEYLKTDFGGNSFYGRRLLPTDKPYYYYASSSVASTRAVNGFQDPTTELQSFFGRAIVNLSNKYIITGTLRADGSSKFGTNNRYGIFPSIAAAWNVDKEAFMSNIKQIGNLKLRASYGITGNQEFPAGASQLIYGLSGNPGNFGQIQIANPDLQWEETASSNIGLEFTLLQGKINVGVDYFNRNTSKILFPAEQPDPVPATSAIKWTNIKGNVINKGLEITLGINDIIKKNDFTLSASINYTALNNTLKNFSGELPTGEVSGQGLTGAYSQLLKSGYPINTFYLKKFIGIDKTTGISQYEGGEQKFFLGSANPKTLIGLSINAAYKKLGLEINMNGTKGGYIYNNTTNAVSAFNNLGKRNIGKTEYDIALAQGERGANPTSASSRYLEKGDYLKMANLTVSYSLGALGKSISNSNFFITGQNLFVITNYSGFDPEVNTSKPLNGVPSFGLELTPYPTSRTFNFGFNFTF